MEHPRHIRVFRLQSVVVLALCLAGDPLTAWAGQNGCPAAAEVGGSATSMVTAVVAILRQHGVARGTTRCAGRVVRASLNLGADARSHLLHIDDGFGRTSDRKVADARTAASLIESWTLDEDAPLLSPKPREEIPSAPLPIGIAMTAVPPATAASPAQPTWRIRATADLATASVGNPLFGASATGCGQVGLVCLGGRARIARSSEATQLPDYDITRVTADFLAVAAVPLRWRRMTFAPLLGVGVGWTRSSALPDPFTVSRHDTSMRAEAATMGGLRVTQHWSIVAEVGASAGRQVSTPPTDLVAVGLGAPPNVVVRASMGIEYAR